jgi:hypothetical protein
MTANENARALFWFSNGQRDALQGRESLAAVLHAAGDDIAAPAYLEGWREGMAKLAA